MLWSKVYKGRKPIYNPIIRQYFNSNFLFRTRLSTKGCCVTILEIDWIHVRVEIMLTCVGYLKAAVIEDGHEV